MNELPKINAMTTITAKTIRTPLISTSHRAISTACFLHALPFPLRKMMVQRMQYFLDRFQVRTIHWNNVPVKFAALAQFQESVETVLVRACQCCGARNDFMRGHWRRFSKDHYGVAKQRQHARKRFSQYGSQFVRVPRRAKIVLPQFQKHRTQVSLDLQSV